MSDPLATHPGPIWRKEHARLALLNAAIEKLQAAQVTGDLARVKEAVELLEDLKRSLDEEDKQDGKR
jgi:hypothetical protein